MQWRALPFLADKEVEALLQAKKEKKAWKEWESLKKQKIRFVPYFSAEYPKKLLQIPDPPYALYVKGSLPEEGVLSGAIWGRNGSGLWKISGGAWNSGYQRDGKGD